jgi:glutathione-specific gamma-glutamylcyclotransferase
MAAKAILNDVPGAGGTGQGKAGPVPARVTELGLAEGEALWVFGYGSLMWNPGFPHLESRPALLRGYHRRFCVYSHRYRGTPERPGLVLGLDRGGSCRGIAFRVARADEAAVLDYLWDREMINGVYRPRLLPLRTPGGEVRACAFVAERGHVQYCGDLGLERVVDCIRQGCGERGPNLEYLANTVRHLRDLGIRDGSLERLLAAVDMDSCRAVA